MALSRCPARMKTIKNALCNLLCALRFAWQVIRYVGIFFWAVFRHFPYREFPGPSWDAERHGPFIPSVCQRLLWRLAAA